MALTPNPSGLYAPVTPGDVAHQGDHDEINPMLQAVLDATSGSMFQRVTGGILQALSPAATRDHIGAQPVDSDLTAIAALATTTFGRSLLTQLDAVAARSKLDVWSRAQGETPAGAQAKADASLVDANAYTDAEVQAAVKAGAVNPRGAWDAGTAYDKLDLASHAGNSWYASEPTLAGEEPGVSPKWVNYASGIDKATADADYSAKASTAPRLAPTVAASDAPAVVKELAEYVCDGVNDEVQILAALNGLATRGGTVELSRGVFFIDATFNIDTYRHLIGQGEFATKLSLAPGTIVTISSRHSSIQKLELNAWDRAGNGRTDGLPIHAGQGLLDFTGTTQSGLQSFAKRVLFFGAGRGLDTENLGTYCVTARTAASNPEVANYFHTIRDCYFRSAEKLVVWENRANAQRLDGSLFTDYWVGIEINADECVFDGMFHNSPGTAARKAVCVDILGDRGDGTAPQLNRVTFEAETGTDSIGLRTAATTGSVIFTATVNMVLGNDIKNTDKVCRITQNYSSFPRVDITVDPTDGKSAAPLSYLKANFGRWKPRSDRLYKQPGAVSTGTLVLNRLYYVPLEVVKGTATLISAFVDTAGAAGAVLRIGLYADDGAGKPGTLIVDPGTRAADTTGAKGYDISQAVVGPVVWLAAVAQVATSTVATTVSSSRYVGSGAGITGVATAAYFSAADDVSGALPASAALNAGTLPAGPLVGLQITPA